MNPVPLPPPPTVLAPPPTVLTAAVQVVRGDTELEEHVPAWQELARDPLEPNSFLAPWLLLPARRAFGADSVRLAFVYGPTNPPSKSRVLLGVFPVEPSQRIAPLVPGRIVRSWRHLYGFLLTPLLHPRRGAEALHAFFDWLRDDDRAALWEIERVSADGPFIRLLADFLEERNRPSFVVESHSRAALELNTSDGGSYLKAALPHRRLKEYRRQERLLEKRGQFEKRVLTSGESLGCWIEWFLDLEASGWKGNERTAMKNDPAHANFFRSMCQGAFARGQLLMLGLFLDGKPLALKCNLLCPPGSFAFKIAFDESFAPHSPGVLLELFNVEHLHAARPVQWMDSCAVSRHFMINRLWTERRLVQTIRIATGRAPGDLLVALYPLARWTKRKFLRKRTKDEGQQTNEERREEP